MTAAERVLTTQFPKSTLFSLATYGELGTRPAPQPASCVAEVSMRPSRLAGRLASASIAFP
jgi:hypothetical protein